MLMFAAVILLLMLSRTMVPYTLSVQYLTGLEIVTVWPAATVTSASITSKVPERDGEHMFPLSHTKT